MGERVRWGNKSVYHSTTVSKYALVSRNGSDGLLISGNDAVVGSCLTKSKPALERLTAIASSSGCVSRSHVIRLTKSKCDLGYFEIFDAFIRNKKGGW